MEYSFGNLQAGAGSAPTTIVARLYSPSTQVAATTTGEKNLLLSLDRPATTFGQALAVKDLRICARAFSAGAFITETNLRSFDTASLASGVIALNTTDHPVTPVVSPIACYTVAPASPVVVRGPLVLHLVINFTSTAAIVELDSATLTLTPVAATP